MSEAAPRWQAWVDGTASPNPGRLGVGLVLVAPDGERRELARPLGRNGCNNSAELLAIVEALTQARHAGAQCLTIHSDSRFAVDCLNGRDDTAVPALASLLAETRQTLAGFTMVEIAWLPRHRNGDADRLARGAVGLPPKPAAPPPGKHRQRKRRR